MALTQQGFWLTIEMRDSGDNRTSKSFEMTAATAAAAETDAAAIIILWNALTDAEILGYTVSNRYVETAPAIPSAGVHIENVAEVLLQIEGSAVKRAVLSVPAPVAGMFEGATGENSNIVDTAFQALVDFVASFGTLGNNTLLISDGEHADGIAKGRRVHRKSRRG
jgi:hypothetical protein